MNGRGGNITRRRPCSSALVVETATAVAMLILAILLVSVAIADLVAVVVVEDQDNRASSWKSRIQSCRSRIVEAVPLTAIKIVLVAWQIITQVRGLSAWVSVDCWQVWYSRVHETVADTADIISPTVCGYFIQAGR